MIRTIALLPLAAAIACAAASSSDRPTFYRDVLPILQDHCQECHRAGEIAPFALTDYKNTRPWAQAIKSAVLTKKMPPWFADPQYGHFSNDRSLSKAQIEALAGWVDAGAPEGNATDAPPPKKWVDGWNIPEPDAVVGMKSAFPIPAKGDIPYQYIVIPTGFTEDKWVQMTEIKPSNAAVVHHVVVFMRRPGSHWLSQAKPNEPYVPPRDPRDVFINTGGGGPGESEILGIYTPGMIPDIWRPGLAKLISKGTDFVLQLHYTTNGTAGSDQTKIGMVFAKEPPTQRALTLGAVNMGFRIPPQDPNYPVVGRATLPHDAALLSFFPHMHLRGKSMRYEVVYPDGRTETLLNVPKYDFYWQLDYKLAKPLDLPAGTKIVATAAYDNSPNNPKNPDPTAEVRFGEQSWEEMMIGFFDVVIPADMSYREFFTPPKKAAD